MTAVLIGPDVSGFQDAHVLSTGDYLFAFVKATEGLGASNRNFTQQWSDALRFELRGAYHYARPHKSDGIHQAQVFCDFLMANGFRPGRDMWALDIEGLGNDVKALGNEAVTGPQFAAFTHQFMDYCTRRLGPRGFLYVGMYFFPADMGPLTHQYPWWLPYYGRNNGTVPAIPVNPVLHQFTSNNGLDRSIVHDITTWRSVTGATTPAHPAPLPRKEHRVLSVQGVPVLDANHNPFIDIADGGKSLVAFYSQPFPDGPQVKVAFGLQTFALAPGETATDIAPGVGPHGEVGVVVRLSNNEAHFAAVKPGVSVR